MQPRPCPFLLRTAARALGILALALGLATDGVAQTPVVPLPADLSVRARQALESALLASREGDAERARQALERGIAETGPGRREAYWLHHWQMLFNADLGDMASMAREADLLLQAANTPGLEVNAVSNALTAHAVLRNRVRVQALRRQLDGLQLRLRQAPSWSTLGDYWQALAAFGRAVADLYDGDYLRAAQGYRACRAAIDAHRRGPAGSEAASSLRVACDAGLVEAELHLGNLATAGALADGLRQSIDQVSAQGRPLVAVRFVRTFARLALEQGKPTLARSLQRDAMESLRRLPAAARSDWMAQMQRGLAQLDMLAGRWPEALAWHRQRLALLAPGADWTAAAGRLSADHGYTLLRAGQPQEALALTTALVALIAGAEHDASAPAWEARAVHGLALAANGRRAEGLAQVRLALPRWLALIQAERNAAESGSFRTATMQWLLEGAIDLLAEPAAGGDAAAIDEAFRLADVARGSSVQQALAASLSRARIDDPALAALARSEQDLQREIGGLADALGNLLARGRVAEQDGVVAAMRRQLASLREQHARALAEIERRFPRYAGLLGARPLGLTELQGLLRPGEALVSIFAGRERTLVWSPAATGPARFAVAPLPAAELERKVGALRRALDPEGLRGGRPPVFPQDLAYELFAQLLQPVQASWQGAQDLIVVPHGGLGQLPLGVLLTQPPATRDGAAAPPADAPWLLRQVAVSQLPAAAVLASLRGGGTATSGAPPARAARPFVGFGDPWFVPEQAHQSRPADGTTSATSPAIAPATGALRARALRSPLPASESLAAAAMDWRVLAPLPDTRLEIEEVAAVLGADRTRDLFLGRRASEARVKQLDLSPYRVVMFATHGLMGGELPGLYQPALALSNPALTGDGEDGLLTLDEILGLKLSADWVVLSACNTAAADGPAGESVSGLGRAFFYAGAKALLVTQWAVETESARLLTTDTFRRQAANPGLSRAQALRQAALALQARREGGAAPDYAHPMFWAPFTLVGDGG